MVSRICSTSASVSWLTRRCSGMPAFSQTSLASFGPMPWMYWRAMTTRFCVGMLTPAMRATSVSQERRHRTSADIARRLDAGPNPVITHADRPRRIPRQARSLGFKSRKLWSFSRGCHISSTVQSPSAAVLCSSFDLAQHLVDFLGHLGDGRHAVHRPQVALAEVVADAAARSPGSRPSAACVTVSAVVVGAPRELGRLPQTSHTPLTFGRLKRS